MRAVVDRFNADVRAYLVLEGLALGQVYHRGLGVQRYRIHVQTQGGHSWVDFGRPSAIHELAILAAHLASFTLPRVPRTSLNIGVISGGTSVNTIAAHASLELDLRSENESALQRLVDRVMRAVDAADRHRVSVQAELIGNRPVGMIPPDHPLVQLAIQCLEGQGLRPNLNIGSTDANIPLSHNLPAIGIGLTWGEGAHTLKETIQTAPLALGMAQLVNLVKGVYQS
jgi:di/tripeptidase